MNWVESNKKLPHNKQVVLIWRKSEKPAVATFYNKDQFGEDNIFVVKDVGSHIGLDWVTHWCEIESPYKDSPQDFNPSNNKQ